MATLSEQVLLRLGYSYAQPEYPKLLSDLSWLELLENQGKLEVLRVAGIVSELEAIDLGLIDSRANSMALQVGDLRLQYVTHIKHLNLDGRNLESELSRITQTTLYQSKYRDYRRPVSYIA